MKHSIWIVFFLITVAPVIAQEVAVFDPGVIVTKKGDSLKCFVRRDVEFGSAIVYKKEKNGAENSVPTRDIKFIASAHQYSENIQVGKKELLMGLVAKGKALLFLNVTTGAARRQSLLGISLQSKPVPILVFVLKKGSIYTEVKRERYREILSALMFDCPWLAQKMRGKDTAYPYEEMEKAVEAYNSCQ